MGVLGRLDVRRRIAQATSERLTERSRPTGWRDDPGAKRPWRVVANVLVVAALELRNPVLFFILVEADDLSIHV